MIEVVILQSLLRSPRLGLVPYGGPHFTLDHDVNCELSRSIAFDAYLFIQRTHGIIGLENGVADIFKGEI